MSNQDQNKKEPTLSGEDTGDYPIALSEHVVCAVYFADQHGDLIEKPYTTLTQLVRTLNAIKVLHDNGLQLKVGDYFNDGINIDQVHEVMYRVDGSKVRIEITFK